MAESLKSPVFKKNLLLLFLGLCELVELVKISLCLSLPMGKQGEGNVF